MEILAPLWKVVSPFINPIVNHFGKSKDRRVAAAAQFRERVLSELKGLYPQQVEWPAGTGIDHRLRQIFSELQAAVAAYRPYVSDKDKAAFDEAWLFYRTATKREIDVQCYLHYLNITTTAVNSFGGQTVITTFKRNMDRLLSFARDI